MDQTITLNSKVFNVTSRPSPTVAIFTTRSRGLDLPDTLQIAHRTMKNLVQSPATAVRLNTVTDSLHSASIQRTYLSSYDSAHRIIQWTLSGKYPSDADATNVAAGLADLTDFIASAITLRSANIASLQNGETP